WTPSVPPLITLSSWARNSKTTSIKSPAAHRVSKDEACAVHPMLRIGIYAIQASKLSRGCPRLPFWQGPMRSQQPSRTVVDRLVDEIPLRLEGRSCDEHLFRTESDPERTSVSSSPTEELAPVAPTGADDDDEQAERQVDGDDLADAVEAGAGVRPVLSVDGPFEYPPRSVE